MSKPRHNKPCVGSGVNKNFSPYIFFICLLVITSWVGINTAPIMGQNTPAANTQSNELAEAQRLNKRVIELYEQGQYGEAVPLAKRALDIRIKVLGKEHADVAESLNHLANLYNRQGRYIDAENLYIKALVAIRKRLLGEQHPDVVSSLKHLVDFYTRQGRYIDAQILFSIGLHISRTRLLVEQNPDIVSSLNHLAIFVEGLNHLANLYNHQGRFSEVEPLYQQVLAIRKRLLSNLHPSEATRLNNLTVSYQQQKEGIYLDASFLKILAMGKRLPENQRPSVTFSLPPFVTTSLNNDLPNLYQLTQLANLYSKHRMYSEAEPLLKEALAIYQGWLGDQHPSVAQSLNDLANLYSNQGRYGDAEPLYTRALAMKKRLLGDQHPSVAQSLNDLANLYSNQGSYGDAEPLYKQALAMRKWLLGDKHPSVAQSLNDLANLYSSQGKFSDSDAEPLLKQALAIYEERLGEQHPSVAQSLNDLANLYSSQGRYGDAEPLLKQALVIYKERLGEQHPSVAQSLNNLANLYSNQGRYGDAEPLLKQALAIYKERLGEQHPSVAQSLNDLANLYSSQGRYGDAEPLLKQALLVAMTNRLSRGQHPSVAQSLNNLANLYSNQERYSDAEPLYQRALAIYTMLLGNQHPFVAQSLNNLASLYWAQGNINRSVELFTQGLDVEEKNLNLNIFAGFERQKRDYMRTISGTQNAIISLHLNSAAKNPQAANLALTTVLQRKGRILDVLTTSQQILRQRIDDPESQKLLNDLSLTSTQLANLYYNKPKQISDQDYNQKITDLNNQIKELESKISSRSQGFRTQFKAVNLSEVKNLIPTDTALVEIIRYQPFNPQAKDNNPWGKARYAAYVLTSTTQVQGIDLGKAEDIDKAVDVFRTALGSDPNSRSQIPQIKYYGHNLYKKLIQPIQQFLGNHRKILISPDSHLNLIPFEALVDNNQDYLVQNYSFTYLTSGRDLLRLQNSQHIASKQTPVLIADPYFHRPGEVNITQSKKNNNDLINSRNIRSVVDLSKQAFSSLPGTKKEAQAIAPLLGVKPLMGSQATETVVKNVNSPKILHVATHGFFETANRNTDNPLLFSGLVLAGFKKNQGGNQEDGVLTALETTNLNLVGTKLVVFSACNTGLGDVKSGEGIYGLRRALVIAGSQSQLISLWKVDDNPTKDLMVAYYNKLLGKQGRSQALRQTQLDMLNGKLRGENKKYDHPYYWAAFIPSGDWRAMGE
ncbi:MAG: CHAT domain-containing protein [Calothrix sp. MO_167.B42]|nr:CHAT domain-containing protein [Calothrix sp. MO_167.B42]